MNKTSFWNKKVLKWESSRYANGGPIVARLELAINLIAKCISMLINQNKTIICEFGCGSGIFAEEILKKHSNIMYYGFDISGSAIAAAEKKNLKNAKFINIEISGVGDYLKENNIVPDVIVSLGLFDWLTDSEREMLRNIECKYFLHSFSQDNKLLSIAHKVFVYLTYGFKDASYVPRYDSIKNMVEFFGPDTKCLNTKKMNIAMLASNILSAE